MSERHEWGCDTSLMTSKNVLFYFNTEMKPPTFTVHFHSVPWLDLTAVTVVLNLKLNWVVWNSFAAFTFQTPLSFPWRIIFPKHDGDIVKFSKLIHYVNNPVTSHGKTSCPPFCFKFNTPVHWSLCMIKEMLGPMASFTEEYFVRKHLSHWSIFSLFYAV